MAGHSSDHPNTSSLTDGRPGPVVVSGLGSSGTRVVARILEGLGHNVGRDLNAAADNLLFTLLMKRPRVFVPLGLDTSSSRAEQLLRLFADLTHDPCRIGRPFALAEVIRAAAHQVGYGIERPTAARRAAWSARRIRALLAAPTGVASVRWAFKEPTAHLFLPALRQVFQDMRYVHVMRDPRDYAVVPHNQYALWAGAFPATRAIRGPLVRRQLAWWADMNLRALQISQETETPTIVVRLEELCDRPEEHVERLSSFTGAPCTSATRSQLAALVTHPQSRGRGAHLRMKDEADARVRDQMSQLGYRAR